MNRVWPLKIQESDQKASSKKKSDIMDSNETDDPDEPTKKN